MLHDLEELSLTSASTVTATTLAPLLGLVLLAVVARRARDRIGAHAADPRRTAGELALGALLGALFGYGVAFLLGDVMDLFGVVLSTPTRGWTTIGGTGLGVLAVTLARSRRSLVGVGGTGVPPRRLRVLHGVLGVLVVPLVVLSSAVGINTDLQEYPNVAAAFGLTRVGPLDMSDLPAAQPAPGEPAPDSSVPIEESWTPSGELPARGRVGMVSIPGTASGFVARDAVVYLPPAAQVADAPELPVVVAMSGQPGKPLDLIASGRFESILDAYAAAHHGIAPIVVMPDQLGSADANPMCVDSPLGNSDTYLSVDVPAWIHAHLRVLDDRTAWSLLGFSQGGTCAAQLGAGHPDVFGSFVDISGEIGPWTGPTTIDVAFGGSHDRYAASIPSAVMSENRPYADTQAVFCVGEDDSGYRPGVEQVEAAAHAAGIDARLAISPNSAHDWGTVKWCVADALPTLGQRLGLTR
ncbi:putative esterase [Clavibacter michiganensis]|uniref:Putative esterase n=1 Tax=Clavibacter michiganensis TaxID=28447 RepID=A0A251YS37_9MICO|nr:alpha/beta hydrolase-fold protein [Clavibacter michiganensis]OUE26888.1 putative esterase [Clavibacter michiganensis]